MSVSVLPVLRYPVRNSWGKGSVAMDYIWTPWRYQYMAQAAAGKQPECIFCDALALNNDAETLIVHRSAKTFVILNRFPYTSGHVMVVPYAQDRKSTRLNSSHQII